MPPTVVIVALLAAFTFFAVVTIFWIWFLIRFFGPLRPLRPLSPLRPAYREPRAKPERDPAREKLWMRQMDGEWHDPQNPICYFITDPNRWSSNEATDRCRCPIPKAELDRWRSEMRRKTPREEP